MATVKKHISFILRHFARLIHAIFTFNIYIYIHILLFSFISTHTHGPDCRMFFVTILSCDKHERRTLLITIRRLHPWKRIIIITVPRNQDSHKDLHDLRPSADVTVNNISITQNDNLDEPNTNTSHLHMVCSSPWVIDTYSYA